MNRTLEDLTTEEWGKLFPITISPYNPNWVSSFHKERELIETTLKPLVLRSEHFGSTSVPGLPSKDTIDILVEISAANLFSQAVIETMQSIGYHYLLQKGDEPDYMIFVKGYNLEGIKEQTFHIHMSSDDHPIWDRIYFRDYLRKNPDVATDYANLKYKLSKEYSSKRVDYRIAKTDFVSRITQIAKEGMKSD